MENKKTLLSLIVNTHNEEGNIGRCLQSAAGIAGEIIVTDMKSIDGTKNIVKAFGARVYEIKQQNYVEKARNYGVRKARGKWILILDPDEELSKSLSYKILNVIEKDKCDVVYIPFKSILYGKWMKHTGWWPDYHPRLFKKGFLDSPPMIHAAPIIKGRVLTLEAKEENAIIHHTTPTVSGSMEKIDRYTSFETYFDKRREMTFEEVVKYYENEFVWRFIDQKGYLDGMRGFVFSKYMEFYRFMVFVKYWEKSGFPEICSPKKLRETIERTRSYSLDKDSLKELEIIKKSKFYRLWQTYCRFRDKLINHKFSPMICMFLFLRSKG